MAESHEVSDTQNCTICLGALIKPKFLPCTHSFCEMCISEYIVSTVTQPGQKHFYCPVCRSSIEAEDPTMDKSKWVSFLPLKLDPEISKVSNENKKQHCHPCKRKENEVNASLWCCACSETFCESCGDVHRYMKISSTHRTVSIDTGIDLDSEIDKLMQSADEFCSIHESRRIEMYCTDHSQAICIQCLSADHRKCENLEMIDSMGELKEESLNSFKSELSMLLNAVKKLSEQKTESKKDLQTAFTSIETESLGTITQLKMKLDDLYIEFLKKAGLEQDKLQDDLDQTLTSLSKYTAVLEEMIHNIGIVIRYGSKVQVLKMTNSIQCQLGEMGGNLYPLLSESSDYEVRASFDDALKTFNNITDLGRFLIANNIRESTWLKDTPKFQNLLITDTTLDFHGISLVFRSFLEFPGTTVKSSLYLDCDISIILTNDYLLQIVLQSTNEVISTRSVKKQPKKLCFDADKNILYGSCNGNSGFFCYVNEKAFKGYKNFRFDKRVGGVDIFGGKGYVVTENAILQAEDFENHETWIATTTITYDDDITFDPKSKRFSLTTSCNSGADINFGNLWDKTLRPFEGSYTISQPKIIAFGPSGLLFVAEASCVIHVISPDEKNVRVLLPNLQKIKDITDITVSHDNKKLYVSGGNYVEIYDIVVDKKSKQN